MGDMIDRDAVLKLAREIRCGSCGGWIDPANPFPDCCDRPDWREGRDAQELARAIATLPAASAEDSAILRARVEDQAAEIARLTRIAQMQPPRDGEDVRAGALKEAAAVFDSWWICAPDGSDMTQDVQAAILALIPEAKPAQDARSANRVEYNDDGTLDEIVTDAGVHLEDLGGNRWFLGAARSDGTEIRVWFRGKVTMVEDDAKESKS